MPRTQKDPNIYTVTIQQTYWMTETSDEKMLQFGAICLNRVVEQVDYYDTDMYDLAMQKMWLSKTDKEWQLIADQSPPERRPVKSDPNHSIKSTFGRHGLDTQNVHPDDTKRGTSKRKKGASDSTRKHNQEASCIDLNSNPDCPGQEGIATARDTLACYELIREKEILAHLSLMLHIALTAEEIENKAMDDFLQLAGIQHYASFHNTKQVIYKVRDIYTVTIKMDGTTSRSVAVISLDVDIENITQGFQIMEQLANELKLQLQTE
ncbi:hypothetical protein FKM82_005410 [Ascaphus truei]